MSTTKNIAGIQRGPDFDREVHEKSTVDRVSKAVRVSQYPEANDPIVQAAIESVEEIGDEFGRKVDVQYERSTGTIVMSVYTADGETLIRRLPPEEAIRMAERLKDERARYFDSVF